MDDSQRKMLVGGGALFVLLVLGYWMFSGPRSAPQMGPSREVMSAVDALFTAVTAKNEKLVAQCETRLTELAKKGELPPDASSYLDGVIKTCRAGDWRPAAENLFAFMKSQRREGALGPGKSKTG